MASASASANAMPVLRPWQPVSAREAPRLPAIRLQRGGGPPLMCAAYRAECVPGTMPPRAKLSLASGAGGLGLGVAAAGGGWTLRTTDFCKGPPRELQYYRTPREAATTGRVPQPEDCICPTSSLDARVRDPLGFDRWVPAGGLPKVPRQTLAGELLSNADLQGAKPTRHVHS